jgi:hypothetical protein
MKTPWATALVVALRERSLDVQTVVEAGLRGKDKAQLDWAAATKRTWHKFHVSDFCKSRIMRSQVDKSGVSLGDDLKDSSQNTSVFARITLKKITDLGQLRAFNMNGRRAYRLQDLEAYVESLPEWYDSQGEKSAKVVGDRRV